jgi:CheY-like chemotaxis protein
MNRLISDRSAGATVPLRKTILVVDDDPCFRDLTVTILSRAGYQVEEAADGTEAMLFARKSRIDLIITDIVMPNREGIETIRYFAKALPNVPIVAISGKSSYLRPAKALGAAATLEKESVTADLLGIVQSVIGC